MFSVLWCESYQGWNLMLLWQSHQDGEKTQPPVTSSHTCIHLIDTPGDLCVFSHSEILGSSRWAQKPHVIDWLREIFVLLRLHRFVHECVSYTKYSLNYRPLQIFVFERDNQLRKYSSKLEPWCRYAI